MKKVALAAIAAVIVIIVLTPVAFRVVNHFRSMHHNHVMEQPTDPNGSFIHAGMAEKFSVSTKDWVIDISLTANRFGMNSRRLSPPGSAATSSMAWDRTDDWFAYLPPVQPKDGVELFVFDGHNNAWQLHGTAQGVSIKSVSQSTDEIPAPVMSRLPEPFKHRLQLTNK